MPSLNTNNIAPDTETLVSPLVTSRPQLTMTSAAINSEPVELDSTPASPGTDRAHRRSSRAGMLEELSPEERQKRDKLIAERKGDPAVMTVLPKDPTAEELEKSGAAASSNQADGTSNQSTSSS